MNRLEEFWCGERSEYGHSILLVFFIILFTTTGKPLTLLRLIVAVIPQTLILLFVAGSHDLLGGWNQTDSAMGTLLILFLLSPAATFTLLIIELTRFFRAAAEKRRKKLIFIALALGLFLEAVAIDFYLLTQVRM